MTKDRYDGAQEMTLDQSSLKVGLRLRYGDLPFQCLFCGHSEITTSFIMNPIEVTCHKHGKLVDKYDLCPDFRCPMDGSMGTV